MRIIFEELCALHFQLLLEWLEKEHVKKWWDSDIIYTIDLVKQKYGSYIHGYKLVDGVKKNIRAYIVSINQKPAGYIQIYNAYDFLNSHELNGLPKNLGALDVFIGEEEFIGQGLGASTILEFLHMHCKPYSYVLVDPDVRNTSAVKCYEKVGFIKIGEPKDYGAIWMIKDLTLF